MKDIRKKSKKIPSFIWVITGIIFFAGIGWATTVSDTGIITQNLTTLGNIFSSESLTLNNSANIYMKANSPSSGNVRTHIFFDSYDQITGSFKHRASIDTHDAGDSADPGANHFSIYLSNETGDLIGGLNFLWNISSTNISYRTNGNTFLGEFDMTRNILRNPRLITGLGAGTSRLKISSITEGIVFEDETSTKDFIFQNATRRLFEIENNRTIILFANTSEVGCGTGNQGAIYYNQQLAGHYGCNGSGWNRMY